ncbi:MAG: hypothetical protein JNM89_01865 [Hyphomicrobiaceae bacterium]|nr:hypothetical protein [Hyphomicrobiaceae bacterium]
MSSDRNEMELASEEGKAQHTYRAALAEQLDYVADMVHELRDMSLRAELRTLAGILDLAYAEARQQAARMR